MNVARDAEEVEAMAATGGFRLAADEHGGLFDATTAVW